ncbi:MAG: hypothetical protein U5L46_14260 [Agrobacterium sp.]|nr:hypothetical protein [Agrobacterium sp.]
MPIVKLPAVAVVPIAINGPSRLIAASSDPPGTWWDKAQFVPVNQFPPAGPCQISDSAEATELRAIENTIKTRPVAPRAETPREVVLRTWVFGQVSLSETWQKQSDIQSPMTARSIVFKRRRIAFLNTSIKRL